MQTKKEEVRQKILEVSKDEILKCGYDKASLRNIAKIVGISHGNIKTYFKTKNKLFEELVRPATEYLDDYLANTVDYGSMTEKELRHFLKVSTTQKEHFAFFTHIKENREVFELLFFEASSDFGKDIRRKYTRKFEQISDAFVQALVAKNIIKPRRLNSMFKHSLSSLFIISIEEIITNDPCKEEMSEYAEEFAKFVHYGSYGAINLLDEVSE